MNTSSLQTNPIGLTAAESAKSLKDVGEETGIGGAGPHTPSQGRHVVVGPSFQRGRWFGVVTEH